MLRTQEKAGEKTGWLACYGSIRTVVPATQLPTRGLRLRSRSGANYRSRGTFRQYPGTSATYGRFAPELSGSLLFHGNRYVRDRREAQGDGRPFAPVN